MSEVEQEPIICSILEVFMKRFIRWQSAPFFLAAVLFVVTVLTGPGVAGAMGTTTLPVITQGGTTSRAIEVWYPSKAPETARTMAVFVLSAAWDAAPTRGNGALVILSHGSGGSATTYWDMARVLVGAGFVVAAPEHDGDNWQDQSKTGPDSWKQRPAEVSRAIDRVQADPRFAPLLEKGRVGVYGMSAGGLTALEFSGATWSVGRLVKHCADHFDGDLSFCAFRELTASSGRLDQETRQRLKAQYAQGAGSGMVETKEYGHQDSRVKAVVAAVPVAAVIDPASLKTPRVPTALVPADLDQVLAPAWHVKAIKNACESCTVIGPLRSGGHMSILSPLPEAVMQMLGAWAKDPPGFDRASLVPLYKEIAQFFARHLAS
jgi:predicted dienelactone hydrolase